MDFEGLNKTARALVAEGRGILAADESTGTIKKRFDTIGVESTEETRRAYRDLLFTTPDMEKFISGVIMYDETIRQSTADGVSFSKHLADMDVIPGIKVDKGAKPLAGHPDEKVTEGLDGLRDRLKEYADLGAKFAKWRAVITISDTIPSDACISVNAHALARYAALCQEAGIVPIVEPEVLMNGAHGIDRCEAVTSATLKAVFNALTEQGVYLEGMLLKPNMVISGEDCPQQAGVEEVAAATVRCLRRFVPAAVPGIVFLSGGQSAELATEHLNAMHKLGPQPWALSFSYGRALQAPALDQWRGQEGNVTAAKQAFRHRAECNSAATRGTYSSDMETQAAA
ncbi:MAG TPA: class I fructose-bisphosphate aldolase [Gammaproteobacteria bacterium]|nr:class I fructose-bisphosphate aldolase [Gammaproteobacteria bacterium]